MPYPTPLSDLPIEKANWQHNMLFQEMIVAMEWGIRPFVWRDLDPEERAIMVSTWAARKKMDAFDSQVRASNIRKRNRQ